MKLIFRKSDSASRLLMFIFNIYGEQTKKRDMKLSVLLEILKIFGKSESAIRMSLSRAVKAGLLVNVRKDGEVCYVLTNDGAKAIAYWNAGVISFFERYRLRQEKWDRNWYVLIIDSSDNTREMKAGFLDRLQQRGFAEVKANTWATPFYTAEETRNTVKDYGMEESLVEICGTMTIHQDLSGFLNQVYGIQSLKDKYRIFLDTYGGRVDEIRRMCRERSFIQSGQALLLLHNLGFEFFEIASSDMVLPKEMLADWEGDQATGIFRETRQLLLEAVNQYIDQIKYK